MLPSLISNWLNRSQIILASVVLITGCEQQPYSEKSALSAEDYASAERFLSWNADKYVLNGSVKHHWINDTDSFWYGRATKTGKEYVIVDASTGDKTSAFDHQNLAALLAKATDQKIDADKLNVTSYDPKGDTTIIGAMADEKMWLCDLAADVCSEPPKPKIKPGELPSPDGKWALFSKDHNLFLRSIADDSIKQVTSDGHEHYSYGKTAGSSTFVLAFPRMGIILPPVASWSSDSKRILTQKLDERKVKDMHLLQSAPEDGSKRPVLHSYRYAMPGDENLTKAELYILNLDSGSQTKVNHPPHDVIFMSPLATGRAWWNENNSQIYLVPTPMYSKKQQLLSINTTSGDVSTIIEESSETYIEAAATIGVMSIRTLSNGEIVWYSERDGWGHLYRFDKTGKLINQITSGTWQVRDIVAIDEKSQQITFTASGREAGEDPYFTHLYVANLDGSNLKLLTPGNANHTIALPARDPRARGLPGSTGPSEGSYSPSSKYFVASQSRPDLATVTMLRSADGTVISTVETADISGLKKGGFVLPVPFTVMAADGKTKIYGNIFRPSTFDPTKKYPVIDSIYPGPQVIRSSKSFMRGLFDGNQTQAIAELGFIVITIDGRGTPYRSKSFHDVSYGDLGQAGNLEDHIAGFKQLAEKYPYMDLNRVGIYGHSGGGFASTRAIFDYPDFYKVAVSSSGNHDQEGYIPVWGGTYQGPFTKEKYENASNAHLAKNLKGKLMLVHGEMDDNVHPALTMQVVDALIKANKDFDMLILPNQAHGYEGAGQTYFTRKRWDYFVEHLLGATPPADYQISIPEE